MEYKEAKDKSLNVLWKAVPCFTGESCWCRVVEPIEPIYYDDGGQTEIEIISAGSIGKAEAEHIVSIHNKYIENKFAQE